MLDVTEAIENRRSIRQYTDAPISQDTMDRLISLAVKAPTGSGMEPWGFVILRDRAEIDALSDRAKKEILDHMADYPQFTQYETWLKAQCSSFTATPVHTGTFTTAPSWLATSCSSPSPRASAAAG